MTDPHATIQAVLSGQREWGVACTDVLAGLALLPDNSIHMVVTSPPYLGLRDYKTGLWEGGGEECDHVDNVSPRSSRPAGLFHGGDDRFLEKPYAKTCGKCGATRHDRQIGLEASPADYIATMVRVFAEVRRVLRADGSCWINLGDSFSNKQLLMMPARTAIALQESGWWIRSEIVWCKRAPMPESVTDRPTRATERIYLLTKSARYFYDADAVREPHSRQWWYETVGPKYMTAQDGRNDGGKREGNGNPTGRNAWDYWLLSPESFPGEHYAAYPTEIPRRAILAGTSAYGCCANCGSPYRRVVETRYEPHGDSAKSQVKTTFGERSSGDFEQGKFRPQEMPFGRASRIDTTTGWARTCRCDTVQVRPALVLDPFAGSGTSILVALRLGRRGLGIELSPTYTEMAERRIIGDNPMFNTQEVSA